MISYMHMYVPIYYIEEKLIHYYKIKVGEGGYDTDFLLFSYFTFYYFNFEQNI